MPRIIKPAFAGIGKELSELNSQLNSDGYQPIIDAGYVRPSFSYGCR